LISIHDLLVTKVILHFALAVEQAKEWLGGLGVGVGRKGGGARGKVWHFTGGLGA